MVVRPGFVHTKMTEGMDAAPFSTTPDAVADVIVDGLAKGSEIVWVPGILATRSSCSATCPARSGARSPTAELTPPALPPDRQKAPMDIAVTGSTGLIGSALVERLRDDGHHVLPVVRPGKRERRR